MFDSVLEAILAKEGGWQLTDDPADAGGKTYAGISRRANPHWQGWAFIEAGDALDPPTERLRAAVAERYRASYWNPMKLDEIPNRDLAEMLMSCAVLSGPRVASRLLQTVLGVKVDGQIGPKTIAAMRSWELDPVQGFMALYGLARIARFSRLVEKRPANRKFLRGWVNRVLHELD